MTRIKFSLFISVLFLIGIGSVRLNAQCTPDPVPNVYGAYPSTLSQGCVGQPYSDTTTLVAPLDTTVSIPIPPFTLTIPLDSAIIVDVLNLPAGLSYQCGTANCTAIPPGGSIPARECLLISGTPSSPVLNTTIQIAIIGYMTVPIAGPQTVNDTMEVYLTIGDTSSSYSSITTCNSYTWPANSNNYDSTGIYTTTLPNVWGCDSLLTLDLTINSSSSSFSDSACSSYTSPSGNYIWSTSNTYMDTIPNSLGCDSVMTINLTINNVDTSVAQVGSVLTSNTSLATYQWLDCDSSFAPIPGETSQAFTASSNGNFAVQVIQNGCTDTSACYNVSGLGIDNYSSPYVLVYPNPSNGQFTIDLSEVHKNVFIEVLDLTGKIVQSKAWKEASLINWELTGANGAYLLRINMDGEVRYGRILKK